MVSRNRQELRIGLLVIAALTSLVVLVLVSDRISFDPGYRITVQMRDAGGLNVGSPVKLSGVQIGTVRSISANSLGEINAVVTIDSEYQLSESMPLELASQGIFGDGFLSFSAPSVIPDIPIVTDGTAVIQADSTFFERVSAQAGEILTGVSELTNQRNRESIATILRNMATLSDTAVTLSQSWQAHDQALGQVLATSDQLLRGLDASRQDLTSQLQTSLVAFNQQTNHIGETTTQLSSEAQAVLLQTQQVMGRLDALTVQTSQLMLDASRPAMESLQSTQLMLTQLQHMVDRLQAGQGLIGQLMTNDAMAQDVNETLISANQLVERISDQPEILIWGSAKEDSTAARNARDAIKQRRAFMEGYDRRVPADAKEAVLPSPLPVSAVATDESKAQTDTE